MTASGAEGEAGEAAGCPGRPVPSQRGETEGAAETQGGGDGEKKERGGGGSQVSVRERVAYVCLCLEHRIESAFTSCHFQ